MQCARSAPVVHVRRTCSAHAHMQCTCTCSAHAHAHAVHMHMHMQCTCTCTCTCTRSACSAHAVHMQCTRTAVVRRWPSLRWHALPGDVAYTGANSGGSIAVRPLHARNLLALLQVNPKPNTHPNPHPHPHPHPHPNPNPHPHPNPHLNPTPTPTPTPNHLPLPLTTAAGDTCATYRRGVRRAGDAPARVCAAHGAAGPGGHRVAAA